MAYIPVSNIKVGEWLNTTKEHSSLSGTFDINSRVRVIGVSNRGYDIEDKNGNRMIEIGWTI
jgi:hypothetical protein